MPFSLVSWPNRILWHANAYQHMRFISLKINITNQRMSFFKQISKFRLCSTTSTFHLYYCVPRTYILFHFTSSHSLRLIFMLAQDARRTDNSSVTHICLLYVLRFPRIKIEQTQWCARVPHAYAPEAKNEKKKNNKFTHKFFACIYCFV